MSNRNIVQIMPASGWGAMVADDEAPDDRYVSPLIGWALIQEGERRSVVGMIAGQQVDFCDELNHFFGYVQTQDMLTEALSQMVEDIDDEDGDFEDEDFGDDGDEPPLPPPSWRRKGGRLN
jgi:hypothetical protein